jgi:preprotein translocase subunit SecG
MLRTILMILHFFCALGIVSLVLLQRGKGADAGAGFGSGASGTVFGARGATTALSRATAILAAIFMVTSLSLAYVGARKTTPTSILDQLTQPASGTSGTSLPATPSTAAAPAPATPATPPAPGAAPGAAQTPAPATPAGK